MKKNIKIIDRSFKACCIIFIAFLSATIAFILVANYISIELLPFLLILIPLCVCVVLMIFVILRYCINWANIDEKGIVLKSFFGMVKENKWNEVKDIIIYSFEGTEKVKSGYTNLGGVRVYVPKKIPQKWIFVVTNMEEESGENILEYLLPQKKTMPIRLQHKESIIFAIKGFYEKSIIERTVK